MICVKLIICVEKERAMSLGVIATVTVNLGNRFQGGYAELAAYDTNHDGKISVADLIWSELKVWQDKDRDGETDAGELKSLSALGIRELSLGTTALNATTPQGTHLLSYGSVTFDSGRVSTMFEAIFNSNDTITNYAGEAGRAPWQSASTLNAKGFGTITDLAVAAANDNQGSVWPKRPFYFDRAGPMKNDGALARKVG
jgi:hypothetical protein